MSNRVVSALSAFIFSIGGLIAAAAVVYVVIALVANLFPFESHPTVHASDSPSPSTATSSGRTSSPNSPAPSGSLACAAGTLQIIGSTAFMPIAQRAADAYMQACTGANIGINVGVTSGDSGYGLTQVQDAVNSHSSSAGSMIAMYDGSSAGTTGLKSYPMGALIFSVVAHNGSFGSNISKAELLQIFVQPGKKGVVAVGRKAGSGSRLTFITKVLGINNLSLPGIQPKGGGCPPPTGKAFTSFTSCTEGSTKDLLNFVNETPDAIGYAETYELYGSGYSQISQLSVDKASPNQHDVSNGSYKYWIVEHLYASTQTTALTKDFLDFLPGYLKSNTPPDFIPCDGIEQKLEPDC